MKRSVCMAILAIVGLLALLPGVARADLQDQFDATCKITCQGGAAGTGCVYHLGPDYALVLTAAHVIEGQPVCACEFWRAGHQSAKIPAQVLVADPTIDAAVLVVPLAGLGGVLPKAISLGTAGDTPRPGDTIQSVGCAAGAWATGWQGHVTRIEAGRVFFVPPPAGGRSGSVLTDATGSKIVGLLQIRTGDNSEGGGVSIATLLARMQGRQVKAIETFRPHQTLVAYLETQCPGGSCPTAPGGFGGRAILPWNAPDRSRPSPQSPGGSGGTGGNPWPTLPQTAPTPAPRVDLDPIVQQLERIENRIPAAGMSPIPAAPVADPRVDQALGLGQQAHQRIDGLAGEIKATGEAVVKVGKAVEEVTEVIATKGSLKERLALKRSELEAEGEDPSRLDVLKAVMAEKEKKHWWIVGLIVGGLLFVIWDIRQKRTTGDPLAIEKLAGFMKRRALDSAVPGLGVAAGVVDKTADIVSRRVEALEARLHGMALQTPPPGTGTNATIPGVTPAPAAPTTINVATPGT